MRSDGERYPTCVLPSVHTFPLELLILDILTKGDGYVLTVSTSDESEGAGAPEVSVRGRSAMEPIAIMGIERGVEFANVGKADIARMLWIDGTIVG